MSQLWGKRRRMNLIKFKRLKRIFPTKIRVFRFDLLSNLKILYYNSASKECKNKN